MEKIDELIEELNSIGIDLFNKMGSDSYSQRCRIYDVRKDLETLKAELKEQHKKDVIEAYDKGYKEGLCSVINSKYNLDRQEITAEQYYNERKKNIFLSWNSCITKLID